MRTINTMFKLSAALLSTAVSIGNFALPSSAMPLPTEATKLAAANGSEPEKLTWKKPLIPIIQVEVARWS